MITWRRRARWVRVGLGVVVGALAASGPLAAADPVGAQEGAQDGPRRVVVVSDSVALGARSTLVAGFESAGWQIDVDAQVNRTAFASPRVVEAHAADAPDAMVLSLGANDGGAEESFRARIAAIMDRLGAVERVYWLTLPEVRPGYAVVNRMLAEAAGTFTNLHVIDWRQRAGADGSLTAGDGLHLSPAGAEAMAELVVRSVVEGAVAEAAAAAAAEAPPATAAPTSAPQPPDASRPEVTATTEVAAGSAPAEAAAVTTSAEPVGEHASESDVGAAGSGGSWWRPVLGWTVGGFVLMVVLLGIAGSALGAWSLWRTRGTPSTGSRRSANHPAVRSQQRAARIASARAAALESSDT